MKNAAAIGYALIASKVIGLSEKQREELSSSMYAVMDHFTEEEAEEVYRKS